MVNKEVEQRKNMALSQCSVTVIIQDIFRSHNSQMQPLKQYYHFTAISIFSSIMQYGDNVRNIPEVQKSLY